MDKNDSSPAHNTYTISQTKPLLHKKYSQNVRTNIYKLSDKLKIMSACAIRSIKNKTLHNKPQNIPELHNTDVSNSITPFNISNDNKNNN